MKDHNWGPGLAAMLLAITSAPGLLAQENIEADIDQLRTEVREQIVPQVESGHFKLPALEAPSISTADVGNGRTPDGFRGGQDTPLQPLPESGADRSADWNWSISNWAAPDTFSNPRYFEDRMLERHGHERFGHCQPLASGARFFATVPMLPYLMTVRNPCDCEYTLGYYRSGSRAPALLQRPPYDRRALLTETAVVAGAIIAFP